MINKKMQSFGTAFFCCGNREGCFLPFIVDEKLIVGAGTLLPPLPKCPDTGKHASPHGMKCTCSASYLRAFHVKISKKMCKICI